MRFYPHIFLCIFFTAAATVCQADITKIQTLNQIAHYLQQERTMHDVQLNFCVPEQTECESSSFYVDGILFCNTPDKGEILATFLDTTEYMPEIIVFIDDKEKNVYAIEMITKKELIKLLELLADNSL